MKRWIWLLPLVGFIILVSVFAYLFFNNDDRKDERIWQQLRVQLDEMEVSRVHLSGQLTSSMAEDEKEQVVSWLKEAVFLKSNREGQSPPPQTVLTVTFENGQDVFIAFWGGSVFEVFPQALEPNSQFLIEHPQLGKWLREKVVLGLGQPSLDG